MNIKTTKAILLGSACALVQQSAYGEDSALFELEEIIVTAQKREQSLQDVPLSVSVLSGTAFRRNGNNTIQDLQATVPNLNIQQNAGVARITVRGIGLDNTSPSAEGSIAFHTDGVYIQRAQAALSSLYDLERIEVLRGPQGTLYGRNATGGSINVITAKPTEGFESYARITAGNYEYLGLEGALSGPISEGKILGRLSFSSRTHDGFGTNTITGNEIDDLNEYAVRGQLDFIFNDALTLNLTADYTSGTDSSGVLHYIDIPGQVPLGALLGGELPVDVRDITSPADPEFQREFWGITSTLDYALSPSVSLKSITSYRETDVSMHNISLDPSSLNLFPALQDEKASQFSQELQLTGITDTINWIFGLYYFQENNDATVGGPISVGLVGGPPSFFTAGYLGSGELDTKAYAAFGELTYQFDDKWSATVGLRYSSETKTVFDTAAFDFATPATNVFADSLDTLADPQFVCGVDAITFPACDPKETFNSLTPKLTVNFQATEDTMLYATASRGFKSGTYNLGAVQGTALNPEKVDAYEVGLKSSLLNGRLRANLSAFYYEYTDLQVSKVVFTQVRLENAANAKIFGVEGEFNFQATEKLRVDAAFGYLNATFKDFISVDTTRPAGDGTTLDPITGEPAFDLADNKLPQAPTFSGSIRAEYVTPMGSGDLYLESSLSYGSRAYFTAFNVDNISKPSFAELGASISYELEDGRTRLSLTGKNLTNKTVAMNAFVATALTGGPVLGYVNQPRTIRFSIERSF